MRSLKSRITSEIQHINNLMVKNNVNITEYPISNKFRDLSRCVRSLRAYANFIHDMHHTWADRYSFQERKRIDRRRS